EDLAKFQVELDSHLGGLSSHFECEHRMVHNDGALRWMLARGLAVRDKNGIASRFAGSLTDITIRKLAEEQLIHDALHDALTGLPNRNLFLDRLERNLELARRREDYLYAVLFLDTDRFKFVNDSLGHNIGDKLLVAIAKSLQNSLRETDTVARLGGDEFVILLEDIENSDEAIKITDRIQDKFSRPFLIDGHEIFISTSIGIILSDLHYDKSADILSDADIAMYRAKALGRARYVVFEPKMRTSLVARMEMENDLRRAIDSNEFKLHYQPIISLGTGTLTGFEALVRWLHPEKGMVSPGEFIPIAEESGLILPLGRWILREACTQLKLWHKRYPTSHLSISVNLSSLQFKQDDLAEQVGQILSETGLESHHLKLEITESFIMDNAQSIHDTIMKLKAMGVKVYIDDFGTGYSSLGYLHQFPIDTIKIDRTFIQRIDRNGDNAELVRAILNLARDLKLSVIAEGIETEDQLDQLRELSCEYGQGYYFSRPVDPSMIESLMGADIFLAHKRQRLPVDQ
ncbi:MAG TPA: EAL domain-containing protein, partial [Anaerolineales bacterium]|nr:EAL domain-containing protein [Anaerolineales bacterium]